MEVPQINTMLKCMRLGNFHKLCPKMVFLEVFKPLHGKELWNNNNTSINTFSYRE